MHQQRGNASVIPDVCLLGDHALCLHVLMLQVGICRAQLAAHCRPGAHCSGVRCAGGAWKRGETADSGQLHVEGLRLLLCMGRVLFVLSLFVQAASVCISS
jgi:hypothetical protein